MATKSFYETMVIDTPEAAANLAKAIDDYEQYGAYQPDDKVACISTRY